MCDPRLPPHRGRQSGSQARAHRVRRVHLARDTDAKAMRLERGAFLQRTHAPKLDLQIVSFYKLLLTKGPSVPDPACTRALACAVDGCNVIPLPLGSILRVRARS